LRPSGLLNILAVHPDNHISVSVPHDPSDPERVLSAA